MSYKTAKTCSNNPAQRVHAANKKVEEIEGIYVRIGVHQTKGGLSFNKWTMFPAPYESGCVLCWWSDSVSGMPDTWDPAAHPDLVGPCGCRDGLFSLTAHVRDEEDAEWMRAVLLGVLRSAASLHPPPPPKSRWRGT